MKLNKLAPYALVVGTALTGAQSQGCGGNVEATDNEYNNVVLDAGVDVMESGLDAPEAGLDTSDAGQDVKELDTAEAGVDAKLLTRGRFITELVEGVMGFEGECHSKPYIDVPVDSEYCFAVETAKRMELVSALANAEFRPDAHLNNAELAKILSVVLGFAPYEYNCVNQYTNIEQDSWYAVYLASLCGHDLNVYVEGFNVDPSLSVELSSWNQQTKPAVQSYLSGGLKRIEGAEMSYAGLQSNSMYHYQPVASDFSDIPDYTVEAFFANTAAEAGIMKGYVDANGEPKGVFGPYDTMIYEQFAKIAALSLESQGVEQTGYTGCSGEPGSLWAVQYLDTLCESGLIDSNWMVSQGLNIERRDAYGVMWKSWLLDK